MVVFDSVTVWKEKGQVAGVIVKYIAGGKNRFYDGKETLPVEVAQFICEKAQHCRTNDLGCGASEDVYTY